MRRNQLTDKCKRSDLPRRKNVNRLITRSTGVGQRNSSIERKKEKRKKKKKIAIVRAGAQVFSS